MERCRSPFCRDGKTHSLSEEQMASFGSYRTDAGIGISITARDPMSEATVSDCEYCNGTGVGGTYPSREEIAKGWADFERSRAEVQVRDTSA